jgi:hypothetical protein
MGIEETLDRLTLNVALLCGAVAALAESVNGKYAGKLIYGQPSVSQDPAAAPTPKATRQRKPVALTATDMASAPSTTAATTSAAATTEAPATAAPATDLFGEPAAATAGSSLSGQSQPAAEKSPKAPTLDDVRAAMVDVQTKCGGKAAAQGLLIKFTKDAKPLYSALPEEQYGELIAACKEAVAKAK